MRFAPRALVPQPAVLQPCDHLPGRHLALFATLVGMPGNEQPLIPYGRNYLAEELPHHCILGSGREQHNPPPVQEQDGSWWDFPMHDYHQQYGAALAVMALQRSLHGRNERFADQRRAGGYPTPGNS